MTKARTNPPSFSLASLLGTNFASGDSGRLDPQIKSLLDRATASAAPKITPDAAEISGWLSDDRTAFTPDQVQTASPMPLDPAAIERLLDDNGPVTMRSSAPAMQSRATAAPDTMTPAQCRLIAPTGRFRKGVDVIPLFQPEFADALTGVITSLNAKGITPTITDGYRTPAMQRARQAAVRRGTGKYGAASLSPHEVAMAVDFGPRSNAGHNDDIRRAMNSAGIQNGARFPTPDPLHYFPQGARRQQTRQRILDCLAAFRARSAN